MEDQPGKPKKPERKPERAPSYCPACGLPQCACGPKQLMECDIDNQAIHGPDNLPPEMVVDRHENAAGKRACGTCNWKAKDEWLCTRPDGLRHCPAFDGACCAWEKKPRQPRPTQAKPPRLAIPAGVRFIYLGRPRQGERHQGVMTVAYSVCKMPHLIEIGFSFCSPLDSWVKAKGQKLAVERLLKMPITAPYLYEPRRLVFHITQALVEQRFQELSKIVTVDGSEFFAPYWASKVPGWSKDFAQRLKTRKVSGISRLKLFERRSFESVHDAFLRHKAPPKAKGFGPQVDQAKFDAACVEEAAPVSPAAWNLLAPTNLLEQIRLAMKSPRPTGCLHHARPWPNCRFHPGEDEARPGKIGG